MGSENIIHANALRIRVVGSGNLRMTLFSLDDVNSQEFVPLAMQATTAIQATPLVNFKSQRIAVRLGTSAINEHFRINRVVLFVKTVEISYPQ